MNEELKVKIKTFIQMMQDKGFGPAIIVKSCKYSLRTEEDYDEIISYISEHPEASKGDINTKIFAIYARRCGLNVDLDARL